MPKIAFFGGEPLGLPALEALVAAGLTPDLVVCNPDRPSGRGLELQAPRLKLWSEKNNIEVFQPSSYKDASQLTRLTEAEWDLFIVVAYNFIFPQWLLGLPKHGVVNVHPSLLPKLRGASPIRTAILENRPDDVGVSIMLMDEQMDHGPLLAQTPVVLKDWPVNGPDLDTILAKRGGDLLAEVIPQWLSGQITPIEQEHALATYTKKFVKADSELDLDPLDLPRGDNARATLHKIMAFAGMSDCFFFDHGKRVKIKAAALKDDQLILLTVTPEGKKEMDFAHYLRLRSEAH